MTDLLAIAPAIGKFLLASALLALFYLLLFRGKSSYNHCRAYLLSLAFLSVLLSQFNIEVYTPPVRTEVVQTVVNRYVMPVAPAITPALPNKSALSIPLSSANPVSQKTATAPASLLTNISPVELLVYLYATVCTLLFLSLLYQYVQILRLTKRGRRELIDGIPVILNPAVPTPFSFLKTIFLPPNLTGDKRQMILRHEQWHIRHRHYIDVLLIEVITRLLWFNPVLWWVRSELRNVSEFQADRSVLDEGLDVYKYQTVILEEVMCNNPCLSNGFNNSFTRKRFIQMKNSSKIRLTTLRRVLLLPFFAALFSLLCFTTGQGQVKYVHRKTVRTIQNGKVVHTLTTDTLMKGDSVALPGAIPVISSHTNLALFNIKPAHRITASNIDSLLNYSSAQLGFTIDEMNKMTYPVQSTTLFYGRLNRIFNHLGLKSVYDSLASDESVGAGILFEFLQQNPKNSSANFTRIKAGIDRLKAVKSASAKINGFKSELASLQNDPFVELIGFQIQSFRDYSAKKRLDEASQRNDQKQFELTSEAANQEQEAKIKEKAIKENDERIFREAYRVRPDQLVECMPAFGTRVAHIDRGRTETRVTLSVRITGDNQWIRFDSGYCIIDKKTKNRHFIRRLERNLPLDKTLILSDMKGQTVGFTMVFPPLARSVKEIDIIEFITPGADLFSSYPKEGWAFKNIKISDYNKTKTGEIYK